MKVLLITDQHSLSGGAEQYFFDLKERLKKIPHLKVSSLGFGPAFSQGEDYMVFKAAKSQLAKLIWRIILHPMMYMRLRRTIKAINPDVIHLHNCKQFTPSLLLALKSYPVVQTVHDYGAVCPVGYNIHKNLHPCATGFRWRCMRQHHVKHPFFIYLITLFIFLHQRKRVKQVVRKFFAPSPLLVDYLQRNHFLDVTYIPPFISARLTVNFASLNPIQFFFAGSISAHKGVYQLIDEFALASQKNQYIRLIMAGSGPDEMALRNKIKKLNLESRIKMIGWQNNLSQYYEESIAIIFPSIWLEAFGLVMSEAMSHGRAVIGSNRGSPVSLISHNENGLIFDPCKKGDLSEKILSIANNVELAKRLGRNGHASIQQFIDNDETLTKIITAYQEVTKTQSTHNNS